MKYFWAVFLLLMLALCGCLENCDNNTTGPSPTPTAKVPVEMEDPVRADTAPDLRQVVGVSAFALALRDEHYIRAYIEHVMSYGYNTLRVFSKTDGWADNNLEWLPAGPPMGGGAEQNLKRLLRVTSEYPNFWLELVTCATERDNHVECKQWSKKVANISGEYKNIFISAMNEPQMSNWTPGELNELMDILRASGLLVGVDQPAEPGRWRFNQSLRVDFRAMHPWRNTRRGVHTLTLNEIRDIVRLNGMVLFDETNCYVSDEDLRRFPGMRNNDLFYLRGTGTEKQRQRAATEDKDLYKSVRSAIWFFHSIAGIACDRLGFFLPRWR